MGSFNRINEEFEYLFKSEGGGGEGSYQQFEKSFGWLYNCKMVSEFENISINDVYQLPVYQFLNDLLYLKVKREIDDDMERKMINKMKHGIKY